MKDSVLLSMEHKSREISFSVTITRAVHEHAQRKRHEWDEVEFWQRLSKEDNINLNFNIFLFLPCFILASLYSFLMMQLYAFRISLLFTGNHNSKIYASFSLHCSCLKGLWNCLWQFLDRRNQRYYYSNIQRWLQQK